MMLLVWYKNTVYILFVFVDFSVLMIYPVWKWVWNFFTIIVLQSLSHLQIY